MRAVRDEALRFAGRSLSLFPVLVLVRAYEVAALTLAQAIPNGAVGFTLRGLITDLLATLWIAAVLAVPVIALSTRYPRAAAAAHTIALAAAGGAAYALSHYFTTTSVALGADLFGYSRADIVETVGSSAGAGPAAAVLTLIFAAMAAGSARIADRRRMRTEAGVAVGVGMALSLVFARRLDLDAADFPSDSTYYFAESKLAYFVREAAAIAAERSGGTTASYGQYPLLRKFDAENALGPLLNTSQAPPNIVLVVVEGLGRDFTGPGAAYGGFTPFLDSLEAASLSWTSFVSSTGRTFGALPALLASVPSVDAGFMSQGWAMPPHTSLPSILGTRGYTTSYFTGTNGHFDSIDAFMERQGVTRYIDESGFTPGYAKEPPGDGGFSWGYPDHELFRRGIEILATDTKSPRLDVYLTISTHEPFIPPDEATWRATFDRRVAQLKPEPTREATLRANRGVFESLLYTDDALRYLFAQYARRPDYARTLFIVTGDHRMIPVEAQSPLSRFRVPFIIASPMVTKARRFPGVVSQFDVAPTLLAWLASTKGFTAPDSLHWIGAGLDTSSAPRNARTVVFTRVKNSTTQMIDGDHFISDSRLYAIGDGQSLQPVTDAVLRDSLTQKLVRLRRLYRYATEGPHLRRFAPGEAQAMRLAADDDAFFRSKDLQRLTPEEAFRAAQQLAFAKQYADARKVCRRLLRDAPSFHDARALIGRTWAWEEHYDSARAVLGDIVRRAPEYLDGRLALIDLDVWSGHADVALRQADSVARRHGRNPDVQVGRARALEGLGRRADALVAVNLALGADPTNVGAKELKQRLERRP